MPPAGLRELKKAQTRQAIVEASERLFAERGFEATTIEDIAAAAQVTKKTVFNHFPTKEDLALDRSDDYLHELLTAIGNRPEGTTVLDAFRVLSRRQADQLPTLRQHLRSGGGLFSLIDSTPALQQRMATYRHQLVASLADQLREESNAEADDPWPKVVAWTLVGTQAILFERLRHLAAGTASLTSVARLYAGEVDRVFDRLESGIDTAPTPSSQAF